MAHRITSIAFVATILGAGSWTTPGIAEPAALGGPKLVIYGNYCGPGNNAPLPPVDALDAACARHDACTPTRGLPTRACNVRLAREAQAIAQDPTQTDELRALAGAVAAFAVATPAQGSPTAAPEQALAIGVQMLLTAPR
jgi:hypothetical protein